jgi:hypothetical protein
LNFFDLVGTIARAKDGMCCPGNVGEEMTMRTSSLFFLGIAVAILSIAPVNAAQNAKKPALTTHSDNTYKGTHSECLGMAMKLGWGVSEVSRYCSYHNFKS